MIARRALVAGALLPRAAGGALVPRAVGGALVPGAVGGALVPGAVGGALVPGAVGGALVPGIARAAMPAVPPGNQLGFEVIRGGSRIGTHLLRFTPVADGLDIAITVRIALHLGPIAVFRYTLDGIERWRGGQVASLEARTNDDGEADAMQARRDGAGLRVTGSKTQPYLAPADALPATHWNMDELRGPLINPQDGRLFRPAVADRGGGTIARADGSSLQARQFDLSGDVQLKLWYDAARQWAGLLFEPRDKSTVRYVLA